MLDGILGRGFASKCKSLIKLTKSRIDVIRRKRNATQKFLKKDMADLLANGLDVNAYGRADGLLSELIFSSCYDFVEHCCDVLLKHLSLAQKQSECPEECREAVSSLMCAAARFSDLPELRDLRHTFHERYGNSLDYCLNREFAENLAPKPFTMERKVLLMKSIASEFSIKWNAQDFEQRMSKRLAYEQSNPKGDALCHVADVKYKAPGGKEVPARGVDLEFPAIKASSNERRIQKGSEANSLKRNEVDHPPKWDDYSDDANVLEDWEVPITKRNQFDTPQRGKRESRSERKMKESRDPKMMRPDLFPRGNGDGYSDKGKNQRGSDKNVLEKGNMDASSPMKPGYVDHSAATSSKSQVQVSSFISAGEKLDTSSHVRPGYPDNIAAASSTAAVKVTTSYGVNNGDKNHKANAPLARVKSEGDRSYFEKSEMKEESSLNAEEKLHILQHARPGSHGSTTSVERVKSESGRTFLNGTLPPPYVKPNVKAKDVSRRGDPEIAPSRPNFNGIPMSPALHGNASSDQGHKDVKLPLYPEKATKDAGTARGDILVEGNDRVKHRDEENGIPLPKPRSSRRRHSQSRSAHDGAREHDGDAEGAKRSSRSRRHDSRKGLQILFDHERYQKDEEEKMIDKLLMHYSKKPTTYEGERVKRKSRSRHHDPDPGKSPQNSRTEAERPEKFGCISPTPRSVSLPREQPSAPPQPTKVFTRAATFQADRSDEAKHVHPKLPDYDDLAARFTALKGR